MSKPSAAKKAQPQPVTPQAERRRQGGPRRPIVPAHLKEDRSIPLEWQIRLSFGFLAALLLIAGLLAWEIIDDNVARLARDRLPGAGISPLRALLEGHVALSDLSGDLMRGLVIVALTVLAAMYPFVRRIITWRWAARRNLGVTLDLAEGPGGAVMATLGLSGSGSIRGLNMWLVCKRTMRLEHGTDEQGRTTYRAPLLEADDLVFDESAPWRRSFPLNFPIDAPRNESERELPWRPGVHVYRRWARQTTFDWHIELELTIFSRFADKRRFHLPTR